MGTAHYLKDAMPIDIVKERSTKLEARNVEVTRFLESAEEPPPLLHPSMADHYREELEELYEALQEDSEGKRLAAADILRSLVKEIILTPENGELQIDLRGDLAGILAIYLKRSSPATRAGGSQVKVVAGTGSNHNLRTQKSRPVGAADLRELVSQVKMVAGARFNPRPNFSGSLPMFRLDEVEDAEQLAA